MEMEKQAHWSRFKCKWKNKFTEVAQQLLDHKANHPMPFDPGQLQSVPHQHERLFSLCDASLNKCGPLAIEGTD